MGRSVQNTDLFWKATLDLKALNPKLYDMWQEQKKLGEDYFQDSTAEDIGNLEAAVGASLPADYKQFLEGYSTVIASDIGASYFTMRYRDEYLISWNATLIPWAKLTLLAIHSLCRPMASSPDVGPRVPEGLVPLTIDNRQTLLIDVRPDHYGAIWYMPEIKRQTFGTETYNWRDIGFVASSFTEFLRGLDTKQALEAKYPTFKVLP